MRPDDGTEDPGAEAKQRLLADRNGADDAAPSWYPLLTEAHARIAAFTEERDSERLLADDTLLLAERLWTAARGASGAVPLEAGAAVADLYWHRSMARARPAAEDDDLGAAIAVYALVAAADADAVPAPLRSAVAEARAILGAPADGVSSPAPSWDLRDVDAAVKLLTRAEANDDDAVLCAAIARLRALLRDVPSAAVDAAGKPVESVILSNLGLALRLHALQTGDQDPLNEAVDLTRRAIAVDTADQSQHSAALHINLAIALGTRFSFTGAAEDLLEAVALGQRAVDRTDPDDASWPSRAANLSGLLRVRFDQIGDLDDLARAITLSQAAAESTPAGDPARGLRWSNVSNGIAARYDLRRDPRDLDLAVQAGRRAVQAAPPHYPARGPIIINLANLLLTRFEQFGEAADLDESIRLGAEALALAQPGGPARATLQSNLGNAYRSRYELRFDQADLRHALELTAASVLLTSPTDPALASRLSNRAMTLLTEYERTAATAVLDEAVRTGRQAVAAAGSRPERHSKLLSNLSILLARRGESATDEQAARDLADAVAACESAVAELRPDHPDRAIRLVNLAGTLLDRAKRSADGDRDGLRRAAIGRYQQAAAVETAAVSVRVQAARSQGDLAAQLGVWPEAVDGYLTAISLLGRLVPRAITRPSREQLLARSRQLATNSAASALQTGAVTTAVELLEQGRAVLWSQALERSLAADLATAHPAIAARFEEIATTLS